MVMSKKYEVSFHHYIQYAVIHPKKINFNLCLETIAGTFTTYVRHAMTMKKNFLRITTTFTTPWFCQKKHFFAVSTMLTTLLLWQKKFFFIPTLLSLHNCHEDKILFSYCYYVHYAIITTRNKLIFILTLPSLHNCHEKNTVVLSGSPVFLKDSWMIQQFHRQELQ